MDVELTRMAVNLLADSNTPSQLQSALRAALAAVQDPESTRWILDELSRTRKSDRIQVLLQVVLHLKDPSAALPSLLNHARSTNPAVRIGAHEALGRLDDPKARQALEQAMSSRNPLLAGVAIRALGQHASRDPKLIDRLKKMARGQNTVRQLAAIDALGLGKIVAATDLLITLLENRRWTVRAAAVLNLRRLRVKEAIGPLIDLLETAEGRLRGDIADALEDLTGQPFGITIANWRSWWNVHEKTFKVSSPGSSKKKIDDGASVSGYYGIQVLSQRVLFLVDISGSMSTAATSKGDKSTPRGGKPFNRLDLAKANLIRVIEGFDRKVKFNIIFFDNQVKVWRKGLIPATREVKKEAILFTRQQAPRGGTNIYDPLEQAILSKGVDTIFLLTDGQPGIGKFVSPDDILREIGKLNASRRVKINTIALGGHRPLLENLSRDSGGRYVKP